MIREAMLIGTAGYDQESLRRLRSPSQDVGALGAILADRAVGAYDVTTHVDRPAEQLGESVRTFFADRRPDDTLVLYFSGHGIKDAAGELFLTATDTRLDDLDHTALSTDRLNRWIRTCRSRRVLLILDCCYSGAFPRGMFAKAGETVAVQERFSGRGLAIMTATTAIEYAFEGDELADRRNGEPGTSAFTTSLIRGLDTGEADDNLDQRISLDELYYYVFDSVRAANPRQTPCLWLLGGQGSFEVARRRPGSTARRQRVDPPAEPVVLEPDRRVPFVTVPVAVAGVLVGWLGLAGLSYSPLWSVTVTGALLVIAAVPRTIRAWVGRTFLEDRGVRVTGLRPWFVPWPSILAIETRHGLFGRSAAVRRGDRPHRPPRALPAPDRSWFRPRKEWEAGLERIRDHSVRRGSPTSVVHAGPLAILARAVPALVAVIAVLAGADHPWTWPATATSAPDSCAVLDQAFRTGLAGFGGTFTPVPDNSSADVSGCSSRIDLITTTGDIRLDFEVSRGRPPTAVERAKTRLAAYRDSDARDGRIDNEGGLPQDAYGVQLDNGVKARLRCGNVVVSVAYDGTGASDFLKFALTMFAQTATGRLTAENPGIC